MSRISLIFGTRPEAIKLGPLILALREHPGLQPHVCVTGQHRDMLAEVLEVFGVVPDADLALMRPNQTLGALTARAIRGCDRYLAKARPDMVLVQGDTTSAFCAAMAAYYRRIPVGHVEAGLRTGNRHAPFPEEINRVLITRLADYHFAPTEQAMRNLLAENVPPQRIYVTGNTVVDALRLALAAVERHPPPIPGLPAPWLTPGAGRRLVLVTSHRRENFGRRLQSICRAISRLARRFRGVDFVFPVHPNPNVRRPVYRLLARQSNVHLLKPLGYLALVALMKRCELILTDSGGIQEEAPSLGKPVLVMREGTERPEGVTAGMARLVGSDAQAIVQHASRLLRGGEAARAPILPAADADSLAAGADHPYGDGRASARIIAAVEEILFWASDRQKSNVVQPPPERRPKPGRRAVGR